jgi:hypothetical protein
MKSASRLLADYIKGWTAQGHPAPQQIYSAFKAMTLSDECEQPHPAVAAFFDQLRFDLIENGALAECRASEKTHFPAEPDDAF